MEQPWNVFGCIRGYFAVAATAGLHMHGHGRHQSRSFGRRSKSNISTNRIHIEGININRIDGLSLH